MPSRPARFLPFIAVLALWLVAAAPASAHGGLTYSNPAANAALLEAPTNVELVFAEAVDPTLSAVTLFDEAGLPLVGVGPLVLDATGLDVHVTLPELEPGLFTVAYQTTSAVDGHVVEGTFAFLYDPSGTRPTPNLPTESSSPSNSPLLVAMRWLALAGGLLTLGIAIFWLVSARPALAAPTLQPAGLAPWGWIGLSAGIAFGGIAAYLTISAQSLGIGVGHPGHGGGIIPLDFAAPFGATLFANAMRLAMVGLGVAAVIAAARYFEIDEACRRSRLAGNRERPLLLAVLVAAGASLAGAALAGHASSLGGPIFAIVDWLHLLSVAAWLGALPGLLILAARSRDGADLPVVEVLRRHSRVAIVAAPLVALTGIANSPVVLGAARGIVASDYGNLLLAKALLFSIALALGAANFFFVRADALRRALPVMAVELAIGALAVVVAAGLTTGQPSATRAPVLVTSPAGVVQLIGAAGDSTVHVAVNRPEPGPQRYQVSVAHAADGTFRTDVRGVSLTFTPPAEVRDLPVRSVSLAPGADPWLWGSGGEYTPVVGDWELGVQVLLSGAPPEAASFRVAVTPISEPELLPASSTGLAVPEPLARLWSLLPSGLLGWLLTAGLAAALAATRLAMRASPWSAPVTIALAAVLLVAGLGVLSRETLRVADAPPASASALRNPIAATADSITRGRSLFVANCATCHGTAGRGDGPTATTLLSEPGDLSTGVPVVSDGALAYRIANGSLGIGMPGFALTLTPGDRWDLVNYLRSVFPGATR